MFIQVPESVSKSLQHGHVPRTQIHYPGSSLQTQDTGNAVMVSNCAVHDSRDLLLGRIGCGCGTAQVRPVLDPGWLSWRPRFIPTHEQHRMFRGVYNNLPALASPHGSTPAQRGLELKTRQTFRAEEKGVSVVQDDEHSEEDEIENIESPRSYASSESNSSRDDAMVNLTPDLLSTRGGQAPVPKPRSQQVNPWGKASYSDLITMAITSTDENMMTLSDIYGWIVKNVPYFNDKGTYLSVQGWKNAVRHTLSLRKRFVRVPDPTRPYRSMWTISEDHKRNHMKTVKSRDSKIRRRRSSEDRQGNSQPMDLDGSFY
ncbi:forkhead box protein O1-like [Montipora capricornis]|uniref:forkhead box protein O1-like n=1 Tax=Montipora capricornis TaxID=246305 RepID=UPI0035F21259